jgi:hypothetical protein
MSDPGQGEGSRGRWLIAAPVLLFVGALAVRVVGLGWGLPNEDHYFSYHPDEVFLLLPSFRFAVGEFNPGFFNYGSLYLYLVGLPAVALGLVPDFADFPRGVRALYLEARLITALLGAATVPLLYLALRREHSSMALLSSGLLAVCPLHVVNSHYATVDVPATFFLAVAFLLALRGARQPNAVSGMLAGLAVGLAAATKYNSVLFLLPVLCAPLLVRRESGSLAAWFVGVPAGAALGFLIGNPYVWTEEFAKGIRFELDHARRGGTLAFEGTGSGWAYHLTRGLPVALGYPLLLAAGVGAIAAIVRGSPATRLCLLWVAIYLFAIGFGRERFIRYLVPLTPFLCLLAAWGVCSLVAAKRARGQVSASAAAIVLALLCALYSFGQISAFVRLDPRDMAWRSGQTILASRAAAGDTLPEFAVRQTALAPIPVDLGRRRARIGLAGVPWHYHPPVSPYNAGQFSVAWFERWNNATGSRIAITGWDAERLRAAPPVLFFISDLESADLRRLGRVEVVNFLSALDETYGARAVYGARTLPFSWLGPPRRRQPPDWLYPAPEITMYYGATP